MPGQMELVEHVHLQRAEATAERDLRVGREVHVAKHQQPVMGEPRLPDGRDIGVG